MTEAAAGSSISSCAGSSRALDAQAQVLNVFDGDVHLAEEPPHAAAVICAAVGGWGPMNGATVGAALRPPAWVMVARRTIFTGLMQ